MRIHRARASSHSELDLSTFEMQRCSLLSDHTSVAFRNTFIHHLAKLNIQPCLTTFAKKKRHYWTSCLIRGPSESFQLFSDLASLLLSNFTRGCICQRSASGLTVRWARARRGATRRRISSDLHVISCERP